MGLNYQYDKIIWDKWDGKKESTLPKLEKAILKTFPDLAGDKQND